MGSVEAYAGIGDGGVSIDVARKNWADAAGRTVVEHFFAGDAIRIDTSALAVHVLGGFFHDDVDFLQHVAVFQQGIPVLKLWKFWLQKSRG